MHYLFLYSCLLLHIQISTTVMCNWIMSYELPLCLLCLFFLNMSSTFPVRHFSSTYIAISTPVQFGGVGLNIYLITIFKTLVELYKRKNERQPSWKTKSTSVLVFSSLNISQRSLNSSIFSKAMNMHLERELALK